MPYFHTAVALKQKGNVFCGFSVYEMW